MGEYYFSNTADKDLENLLEFGLDNFGEVVAVAYFDGLVERFQSMTDNPLQYPAVEEIRTGYRLSVYRSHSIYFKVVQQNIEIVRILNGQDLQKALKIASTF